MKHAIIFCLSMLLLGMLMGPSAPQDASDIKPDVSRQIADLEKQIAKLDPAAKPSAETLDLYSRLGQLYLDTKQVAKAIKAYAKGGKIEAQLDTDPCYMPNAAWQVWLKTEGDPQAYELLFQAPKKRPQTAQAVIETAIRLMYILPHGLNNDPVVYWYERLPTEELRVAVGKLRDQLTEIASTYKRQPIADEAEWGIVFVRCYFVRMGFDADGSKIPEEDDDFSSRQCDIDLRQEFIDLHPQSKVLSKARYDLAMVLYADAADGDIERVVNLFDVVLTDPTAPDNIRSAAALRLAELFVRDGKIDAAETMLAKQASLNKADDENGSDALDVALILIDLGKIKRDKGDFAAAKADFKRAVEIIPERYSRCRAEAKALAAMGDADFSLQIDAANRTIYEVEAGRSTVSTGSGCKMYHSVQVDVRAEYIVPDTYLDWPYLIRFTSPKAITGQAQVGTKMTEEQNSSGFHLKFENDLAWGGPKGWVEAEIDTPGEKTSANLPIKDVFMSASPVYKGEGVYSVTIVVNAPVGSQLRVYASSLNMYTIMQKATIDRQGEASIRMGYISDGEVPPSFMSKEGEGWAELPPIDKPGEVTYTFEFMDQLFGNTTEQPASLFVPKLELRVPNGESAKSAQPPITDSVTEVSGALGDIKYVISSPKRFTVSEWLVGDETVIVIPKIAR